MKKLIYNITVLAVLVMTLVSCSDFLDRMPTDYSTAGFFKSEEAIRDGASGVYHAIYLDGMSGFSTIPFTTYFDHFTPLALPRYQNTTISAGTLNPDLAQVSYMWNALYVLVARANSVIDGSKDYIDGLNDRAKQYVSEVRVLRAFAYYHLIATFGDVPFYTSPVTVDQYMDTRTDRTMILDFILDDLELAAKYLPWTAADRGRVDKAVALGLKARAALLGGSLNYGGKGSSYFATAATAAQQVIGQRALAADFEDLLNLNGQTKADVRNEMLWELMYSNIGGSLKNHWTAFGQVSRNTGQTGRHPSSTLADMYECIDGLRIDESPLYDPQHPQRNRDPRFRSTLWMHGDTVTVNNGAIVTQVLDGYKDITQFYNYTTQAWERRTNADINSTAAWASFCNAGVGYIWAKFSNETAENIGSQTCNLPVMRYAEILLSYAEAKIEMNELDQSVYNAINEVRARAGMPAVAADRIGNQQKMRQLVRRERKVEFILEGLFFVDMRRWGIGDILNDEPSYGHPFPWLAQARLWMATNYPNVDVSGMTVQQLTAKLTELGLTQADIPVTDGYTLVTPDMVPNFKKSDRHDMNDVASYAAYGNRLHARDLSRYWKEAYNLWPIPQIERLRNPNLAQNPGYN